MTTLRQATINTIGAASARGPIGGPLIVVISVNTPARAHYLGRTLAEIDNSLVMVDGRRLSIIAQPRKIVLYQGPPFDMTFLDAGAGPWEFIQSSPTLDGSTENALCALGLASVVPAEYLLLFEDDLECCTSAAAFMTRVPVPDDLAFLSFFDSRWLDGTGASRIIELRPHQGGPSHYGNLALKFPGRTLDAFVDKIGDFEIGHRDKFDLQVGRLFGQPYGLYCPSLVQHVGDASLITPGRPLAEGYGRVACNYPGRNYDAMVYSTPFPRELCLEPRIKTGQP